MDKNQDEESLDLEHSEAIPLNLMVSDAYINYMHRRTELSTFVEFYHRLAKTAVEAESGSLNKELYAEYVGHRAYFLENYICRISDIFDLYIEDLIKCVCDIRSDFLPSKELLKAKQRLSLNGMVNPTDDRVIFEACSWFARRGKTEIAKYFKIHLGFDVLAMMLEWDKVLKISTIRNQIVHKASLVDESFLTQFEEDQTLFEIGPGGYLSFSELALLQLATSVDTSIEYLDKTIENFVNLNRRNRLGHFWFSRSVINRPDVADLQN